ncbi:MAG TPA: hypothetical protein VGM83_22265 [Devosiaceae bacterium]|jgi:hypothetical protein
MLKASSTADRPASPTSANAASGKKSSVQPFLGVLDSMLVADGGEFAFDGALASTHAEQIWTWLARDVAPDLVGADAPGGALTDPRQLDAIMPQLTARIRETLALSAESFEGGRRLKAQLGGEEVFERLPVALNGLRQRVLLGKAQAFGRAVNDISDDAALVTTLQSMPLQDATAASLLMMAAVGQVANPSRLMAAAIRIAGNSSDAAVTRAGFGPLIDALLAQAQSLGPALRPMGAFVDIDLICKALDRFHRLIRAVGLVELSRGNRWGTIMAALTKSVSERLEPRLREVIPDLNQSMRRREGGDKLDGDRLLGAINGTYLLATVRDCRDSLALNAVFEQTWAQFGEALEVHINRNLDQLRANPLDKIASARLESAIKMAELRFNNDYADVLRRARDAAERRTPPAENA